MGHSKLNVGLHYNNASACFVHDHNNYMDLRVGYIYSMRICIAEQVKGYLSHYVHCGMMYNYCKFVLTW